MWCALSTGLVLRPRCFDDPTVTCKSYLHVLDSYLISMLFYLPENIIIYQNGSAPHYSRSERDLLKEKARFTNWFRRSSALVSSLSPTFSWLISVVFLWRKRFQFSVNQFDPVKATKNINGSKYTHWYAWKCLPQHMKPLFCFNTRKWRTRWKHNMIRKNLALFKAACDKLFAAVPSKSFAIRFQMLQVLLGYL